MKRFDVIIIGAGAAGLMCAIEAAKRGRNVLVLEKTNRPGKKILMSGGGRCNFTNIYTTPDNYLSHNPHFCKSALSRYTPYDFISLVDSYHIEHYEKKLGQLFCKNKSSDIVEMLISECQKHGVNILLNQTVTNVSSTVLKTQETTWGFTSLVIATGGLSIPTLGSSPLGFQIAEQFGLKVYPTRAGLVPFTLQPHDKLSFDGMSGISVDTVVSCGLQSFRENILFTHRGLSGPAILQISSFWHPGEDIHIDLIPDIDLETLIDDARKSSPQAQIKTFLSDLFPKKFVTTFLSDFDLETALKSLNPKQISAIVDALKHWTIKPGGTEGYRTAEVTLGGVDCDEISSQTFESKKVPGVYFIGEVLDVTGWLGGYNFQWAWASGWAAGQKV